MSGEPHPCVDHFMRWLHGASPCMFARSFATSDPRIIFYVVLDSFSGVELAAIAGTFDMAADAGQFACILFPRLRYANEIASIIKTLLRDERWSCSRVPWQKFPRYRDTAIGLHWRTKSGFVSSAMGFAPLGSMPVSRRAPYVGVVVWPGGQENRFAKKQDTVGFIDGKHGMTRGTYDPLFKKSQELVGELFGDPQEDRVQLRRVAFCLPRNVASPLFPSARRRR